MVTDGDHDEAHDGANEQARYLLDEIPKWKATHPVPYLIAPAESAWRELSPA